MDSIETSMLYVALESRGDFHRGFFFTHLPAVKYPVLSSYISLMPSASVDSILHEINRPNAGQTY